MFKPYCIALTTNGLRVLPARAFGLQWAFAAYIETEEDEKIFKMVWPHWAWVCRFKPGKKI